MCLRLIRNFGTAPVPHILGLSSHPELAERLSKALGYKISYISSNPFSNSETKIEAPFLHPNSSFYVVQSPSSNINNQIMELLLTVQTCRQLHSANVTAIIPCFPYARSDKSEGKNVAIGLKLISRMLEAAGVQHVITVELHSDQSEGFFNIPVTNIQTTDFMCKHIADIPGDLILVAPDAGAMKKVSVIAEKSGLPFALIHKERDSDGTISRMTLVGDVSGKKSVIVDDMADTCGTLTKAASLLTSMGACDVEAVMTHGILSGPAVERINNDPNTSGLTVTNTLPQNLESCSKLKVIDISELIAKSVKKTLS